MFTSLFTAILRSRVDLRVLLINLVFLTGCSMTFVNASTGDVDLALGKPVKVTSTGWWRTPASHIVDGDSETAWRAAGDDPLPYYVQVDLQATYTVERIKLAEILRGGAYRLVRYALFLSQDGVLWSKVHEGSTVGAGVTVEVESEPARYVRLWIMDDDGLNLPMIARISVYGDDSPVTETKVEEALLSSDKEFLSFRFKEVDMPGDIVRPRWPKRTVAEAEGGRYRFEENYVKTIVFVVPEETDLSNLTPSFEFKGDAVKVAEQVQQSGVGARDFSEAVDYQIIAEDGTENRYTVIVHRDPAEARVTVYHEEDGTSMDYVGYSAMNLTEGDNLHQWYRYSNIGSIRYWLTPGRQVDSDNVTDAESVVDLATFDAQKEQLRERMLSQRADSSGINWQGIADRHQQVVQFGIRHTSHYAMQTLREMGIDVMAELNDSQWSDPFKDEAEKWQRAWRLWQMFYAQTFYLTSHFDIWKFQGTNEPEAHLGRHSSSLAERAAAVDRFVFMNAVYADAVRSAVKDVNVLHGKDIEPIFGAPTLASSPTQDVSIATLKTNRTDYGGREVDYNINNLFIMQSYSSDPDNFLSSNHSARAEMRKHNPGGEILPIAYTEFNYMPGAVWRQNRFTSDDPRVFGAMARVWSENMADGLFGMYQFRFSRPLDFAGNHVHHQFATPQDPARNLLYGARYRVSSEDPEHPLTNVLLNTSSHHFAWRTAADAEGPHEVVWEFDEPREIRRFFLNLGTAEEGIRKARFQYWNDQNNTWTTFPSASVNNGSTQHYGAAAQALPGLNSRTPISNTRTVRVDRSFPEPIVTQSVRFISEDPGPITVRRIHVTDVATDGDIGGPMRSAEVTRLFAAAFQHRKPLLKTQTSVSHDPDFKAYTVHDQQRNRYVVWLPQTSNYVDYQNALDFSHLPNAAGAWVKIREVSERHFGEVVYRGLLGEDAVLRRLQPRETVWSVALHPGIRTEPVLLEPTDSAQIGLGSASDQVMRFNDSMVVRQHTGNLDYDRAVYLKFDLSDLTAESIASALFSLHGSWATDEADAVLPENEAFTLHVYGIEEQGWKGESLSGSDAPNFGKADSLITGPGSQPLAVMSFGATPSHSVSALTEWIQQHAGGEITLALVRERRHENEINDTDFIVLSSPSAEVDLRPRLEVWCHGAE